MTLVPQALATLMAAKKKVCAAFRLSPVQPVFEEVLVVSASHAIRWREAHLRENAPVPGRTTQFFGSGGLPLWSEELLAMVAKAPSETRKVLLQQDFRFGNAFLNGVRSATHVDRQLINPLSDRLCKTRGDLAIDRISLIKNTIIVPWSLIGLRSGWRAGPGENAHHPVWNVEEYYGGTSVWEGLFAGFEAGPEPEERDSSVNVLFCDRELHPSYFGYLWLSLVADGRPARQAMQDAQAVFSQILLGFVPDAPPLPMLPSGTIARLPLTLRGTGFLKATGAHLVDARSQATTDQAEAALIEATWRGLAADILDFRTSWLPRVRSQAPETAATFLDSINLLIDIGTERIPSLTGFVWILDNHHHIEPLSEAIRSFLASSRSSC